MPHTHILFDLDGTLTDPKEGITKAAAYALSRFDIRVDDLDSLCVLIGPPLRTSFMRLYGFSESQAEEALSYYREYYAVTGIFENALYPGVDSLLRGLCEAGKTLLLATSKPTVYAEKILEHFHIRPYFAFLSGCELDGRRSEKAEVIRYALENGGVQAAYAVMVGDRRYDVEGATANGIPCIGVLYGYGSREELRGASATAESLDELKRLLLR